MPLFIDEEGVIRNYGPSGGSAVVRKKSTGLFGFIIKLLTGAK